MWYPHTLLLTLAATALALPAETSTEAKPSWPNTPFKTSGNLIKDRSGNTVTYAGVNWPGAADAMLPEGLQYQSISTIVSKIKSMGMNVIRLTYAIEMIDDICSANPNSTMQNSLINVLGVANGTAVFQQIVAKNPQFNEKTTRLDVFDAVAAECYNQKIYVHLDNHVSKAKWCCGTYDGNAWFGDTYYNITNWQRGLSFMASHAKSWKALTSMSLRNELRSPDDNPTLASNTYNWATWLTNVIPAANGIHAANSLPLIFFSGLNYDTTLQPVTLGSDLGAGKAFTISKLKYPKKAVFELHNYDEGQTNCTYFQEYLQGEGYNAMDLANTAAKNHAPVVMTEFGFAQDDTTYMNVYPQCLKSTLGAMKGGFMQWVIAGSYYIREGTQDSDESWGLLNHDWSDWRSSNAVNDFTIPMVAGVLS